MSMFQRQRATRLGFSPARGVGWAGRRKLLLGLIGALVPLAAGSDPSITYTDPADNWLVRRTDPNGELPFNLEDHAPVDLLSITLGTWAPADPAVDLFAGAFATDGLFLRLDVVLNGLINPPGDTVPWDFQPFTYGPNPVYGFIELDMDADADTGGELDSPEYRYLGNAVRFGGLPAIPYLRTRFALDASAFDHDFQTSPQVERSGEEFHLALLGGQFTYDDITKLSGNGPEFGPGDIWLITAPWFHRAHGYEQFTVAGPYMPRCTLRFAHDIASNTTQLSLVFPLWNAGAAAMWGQEPEPPDADPGNQFSVDEALVDLQASAEYLAQNPTGLPEEQLIDGWLHEIPEHYLDPTRWRVLALLGSSYTAAPTSGTYFLWTDLFPKPVRGDMNGDGLANAGDQHAIERFIQEHDGDDGVIDGRVVLSNFPVNFSVYDVNHSGVCDALDPLLVSPPGDLNGDGAVDLADFAQFQVCVSGPGVPYQPDCGLADLDMDGDVDWIDFQRLVALWTGPAQGP